MKKFGLVAAVFAAATITLTGCGGGASEEGPPAMSQEDLKKIQQYSACMKKYNFDIPVPDPNEPAPEINRTFNPTDVKYRAAEAVCARFAPATHVEGKLSPEQETWALNTAECLRKQGVKAKDPAPGSIDVVLDQDPGVTQEQLATAFQKCNEQFPAPKFG
ncbi:hypothetical protein ETD86_18720 [Nonomuraea turkmeniaca]|uniref:Lipoprotein n=1 Tax=Nonomuraea turkmeniaca TaxID=103838 RepID=A0A5S4FIL5_9ACTN|nr:hypothetical protein [Nonomuraea turkmeniaca]TMR20502.1 hypothetical protein ETD86_18720 [Nonomuraea turkmeniaca]